MIAQCLIGGYGWLQVKCRRCETYASIPLEHVRRPRDTPIWKLEAALKCRSCRQELTLFPSLIFSDARDEQGHRRRLMAAPAAWFTDDDVITGPCDVRAQ